ncbi:hypothetical protein EVAR_39815_1 [Eumeta japonica]|uniref:Uncharacterized protein n=1 Tax=Eumeta variegata TaxID=151549 RepID=A0A4C1XBC3_EUMVA|nr:hypothetical protein EVAR_39815_1 [Eumeta japonica]
MCHLERTVHDENNRSASRGVRSAPGRPAGGRSPPFQGKKLRFPRSIGPKQRRKINRPEWAVFHVVAARLPGNPIKITIVKTQTRAHIKIPKEALRAVPPLIIGRQMRGTGAAWKSRGRPSGRNHFFRSATRAPPPARPATAARPNR